MVMIMMQQQTSAPPASHSITAPSSTTTAIRSPTATPTHSQQPSPLSRHALPLPAPPVDHVLPIAAAHPSSEPASTIPCPLARVRLSDIAPYDGAPCGPYLRAVEALSGSLMRHNAAVIELGSEDAALLRCGLEASRLYFRSRAQLGAGKGSRGVYMYRAGRALEDWDSSPPCMADIFRCMGKAAHVALCAIARHLRLRSDVFNQLLDDTPLPANEASSSVLVATYSNASMQNGKGKALSHATAGLRPAASYKAASDYSSGINNGGRTSLAFRLMPQGNAILDCSPIAAAGHVIPQSYVPISVSQFMDDLSAEEDVLGSRSDSTYVARNNSNKEPSLRSVLSDPLSGAFLEDAVVVSCGHSFGGLMLRRVIDTSRCTLCSADIEIALRAAAAAVKHEDDRRLFHNATIRKRRKELGDQMDLSRRPNRENGDVGDDGLRGVQYPFSVNEKVVIKGNRRTPEKFVGKEAVITSQCLNGWYLLKIIETGENVRLQYRSLRKM
ncbi:Protein of unknown function D [Prunus dulcis]|uniref:PUB 62/63 C-terminal domain-containing protein n=1 Tax=Prunus dulcis TaxID=3755 RepID=A0A4Y1QS62_PRUDU|nr:Protein of unknown function D [Prunus dulcis]